MARLPLVAVVLALCCAPTAAARGARPAEPPTASPGNRSFAGQLVVRFRPGARADARRALRARAGARGRRALSLPGLELLELEPGRSVPAARAALASSPDVLYAEPNFRLTPDAVPNDPLWRDQWDMHRIGADRAWDISPGSRDVVAAVFDSGVEIRHPDLQGNLWTNAGETGGGREDNGVDDDGNGYVDDWRGWSFDGPTGSNDPTDYGGHGTNVAGIIGAVGDNGIGLAGVSPRVRIMPFNVWGWGSAGVADAIAYADAQGVRVANGSFGIPRSQAIEDALAAAPGLLLSVSAGNNSWDVERNQDERYPCVSKLPNVICVAATDSGDSLAGFSNWGAESVDLAAPGDDMPSIGLPRHDVLREEFEADLGGRWTTGGTGRAWGREGPSAEWPQQWTTWLLDSPGTPYDNDSDSWIATAEPVSLVDHEGCLLSYWLHRELAAGDVLKVEVSSEGGAWAELAQYTGTENIAVGDHPLTDYEGRPGLKVRFRLVSDAAGQAAGVAVDSVRVWCRRPPFRGDEYPHVGGTSNAAPHVTGTAALLLAQRPWLTTAQLRAAILESVAPQPSLAGRTVTGGRLDTLRALGGTWPVAADPPAPPGDAPPREAPLPLPPPMSRDVRAPRCSLRTARRPVVTRGHVRVAAVCDEASRLSVRLTIAGASAGRSSGALAGAGRRRLSIVLSRRALRSLERRHVRRAVVRLTAVDAAGNRRSTRRRLTLRLGPRKTRRARVANGGVTQPLTHLPVPAARDQADVDLRAAERAAHDLLAALGVDLTDESVRDTPGRMARMYAELLTPTQFTPTTFPNDGGYDELVVATQIPFHSMCEHHLLPFAGVAHVGYLPSERIIGLSKLARVVELYARSLQVQERLTTQVARWLDDHLQPKGVGVVIEAEHLCMSLRGVQKPGARTVTSALHGLVRDDPRTRQEFLALTGASRA